MKFSFKRGDNWTEIFKYTSSGLPVDVAGYSVRLYVRKGTAAPVIEASTDTGEITFDADTSTGYIYLDVPGTEDLVPGTYETDLEVTDGSGVVRSSETAPVEIVKDVTYDA